MNKEEKDKIKSFTDFMGIFGDMEIKTDIQTTDVMKDIMEKTIKNYLDNNVATESEALWMTREAIGKQELYESYIYPVLEIIQEHSSEDYFWNPEKQPRGSRELKFNTEENITIPCENGEICSIVYRIRKDFIKLEIKFFINVAQTEDQRKIIKIELDKQNIHFVHPNKVMLEH